MNYRKHIFFIAAIAGALLTSSCNLDLHPDNAVSTDESIRSVSDCAHFLNGLYDDMKYCTTGGFVFDTDLQTDLYHAVRNFGNFQGDFYHYSVTASTDMPETAWFGLYSYIANANFLLEGIDNLLDEGGLKDNEISQLRQISSEAHFFRAFFYFALAQYYCDDYGPSTAETSLGVPVVLKYDPSSATDRSKYPGRGTLKATFDQIVKDLDDALEYVPETLASTRDKGIYLTKDVVRAMQARVALSMEDWSTAAAKAEEVINSGRYPLVSDAATFADGWVVDRLGETIFQVEMTGSDDNLGNGFSYFIYNSSGRTGHDNPQYVPEDWVLNLYDKAADIRYDAWFQSRGITTPVVGTLTLLVKYPGNPSLYEGSASNYVNKPKVFRSAEMYLIAAEALANMGEDSRAAARLNELRRARINGYTNRNYSGANLMAEIREERVKELFGEGFRLNDIKRWHIGFSRSKGQDPSLIIQSPNYADCTRRADDPLFLWPIPTSEIEANPQMEQNPGYKN